LPSELVKNAIFTLIWTNKVVKSDIKRMRQLIAACKGSFFSIFVPSTIDLPAASVKDPFFVFVAADSAEHVERGSCRKIRFWRL